MGLSSSAFFSLKNCTYCPFKKLVHILNKSGKNSQSTIVHCQHLFQLNVSLPEGRSSHSSVASQGGVFIFGGMDISLTPISSCLYLTHPLPDVWELSTVEFSPLLPPKYSASTQHTYIVELCRILFKCRNGRNKYCIWW